MTAVAAEMAPLLAEGGLVALEGNLGAGKTSLARALIRHMSGNADMDVPSPTFTLLQTYDTADLPIWHFDFYRLKHPEEVFELGWEDALSEGGLVLMEWAERIGPLLPPNLIHIVITPKDDGSRLIEMRA